MKFLNGLIGFVLSLAMLALGWVLVANVLNIPHGYWDTFLGVLSGSKIWQFVLGVTAIILVVLFWLSALPAGRREQFLSFDSEGGSISISVNAINAFLEKLKSEFAGIVELRADVSASRVGAVEARLDMTVRTGTHIQQLSQALQQRVRDSLRDSMGIEEVAIVRVNVQDIVVVEEGEEARPPKHSEWQDDG